MGLNYSLSIGSELKSKKPLSPAKVAVNVQRYALTNHKHRFVPVVVDGVTVERCICGRIKES